ncbi:hypothetical protein [Oceanicola sp. S124]|uniref:hypothetical protein n=1 Tax=Oceanicola sp. S124 TaxID=1042378 RepID=UPI0002558C5D|nr:hypothetical protein [Oceanicola sp. S124]
MTGFLKFVWREHRVLGLVTAAALAALTLFSAQFVAEALYFANPANQERPVEPWMSLRYVERSWDLTKPDMFAIIGFDPDTPPGKVPHSVGEFLRESGMSLEAFQARVEDAQEQRPRKGVE